MARAVANWLGFRVAYLGTAAGGELVFKVRGGEKVRHVASDRLRAAGDRYGSYALADGGSAAGWCRPLR